MPNLKDRLIDAALPHVAFDGWSASAMPKSRPHRAAPPSRAAPSISPWPSTDAATIR